MIAFIGGVLVGGLVFAVWSTLSALFGADVSDAMRERDMRHKSEVHSADMTRRAAACREALTQAERGLARSARKRTRLARDLNAARADAKAGRVHLVHLLGAIEKSEVVRGCLLLHEATVDAWDFIASRKKGDPR